MYPPRQSMYSRLDELLTRTGYQIKQDNGQRVFFNPANSEHVPPRGCEVFVGRLPRDVFEDTLVPILEHAGKIFQLRLMIDFNGKNRGFCFATYFRKEDANAAIKFLDGFEIRPGCKIGIFKSLDNTRLFVGGIPINKTRDEVLAAFMEFVDGIKDVIMYPSSTDQSVNRGYVFIEFESHRLAAIARRRLQPGSLILWECNILVDWAEPLPDPDPCVMSKVTKLYCRNISVSLAQDKFEIEIYKLIPMQNVHKVHKKNDYAFIHFVTRADAEDALNILSGAEIAGRELEVVWARPEFYSNSHTKNVEPNHFCLSIPAKIRRVIRMRQGFKQKPMGSPLVANNFIFPHLAHPLPPYQQAPMPHLFHPNYFMHIQDGNPMLLGHQ